MQTEKTDGKLIPITRILAYADSWGFSALAKHKLVTFVRAMDLAILKADKDKSDKEDKAAKRDGLANVRPQDARTKIRAKTSR